MKITPTQYYLLIEVHNVKSENNIIQLPDGVMQQPYGQVLLCGPDCKWVKPNMKVMFLPQNMIGFEMEKDKFIIPESSVFAILQDDDKEGA